MKSLSLVMQTWIQHPERILIRLNIIFSSIFRSYVILVVIQHPNNIRPGSVVHDATAPFPQARDIECRLCYRVSSEVNPFQPPIDFPYVPTASDSSHMFLVEASHKKVEVFRGCTTRQREFHSWILLTECRKLLHNNPIEPEIFEAILSESTMFINRPLFDITLRHVSKTDLRTIAKGDYCNVSGEGKTRWDC